MNRWPSRFTAFWVCALLFALAGGAQAQDKIRSTASNKRAIPSFTGGWSNALCEDSERMRCAGLVLHLIQDGKRLCGEHFYSTLGAGQLDEGVPRSVHGTVHGSVASVLITSGRDGAVFRARIDHSGGFLRWKRIEQVKKGDGNGALIPESADLAKVDAAEDLENLHRVKQECDWLLRIH
jgi:hypothetical protein